MQLYTAKNNCQFNIFSVKSIETQVTMINAILTYSDSSSFATIYGCKYNILKLQSLTEYILCITTSIINCNFKLIF